jgi:tripartite-type tricarboxylate transporter receptor subunit TctC
MKRFLIAILTACIPLLASAQAYPAKQVRLVVPFAPGGPADAIGRIVGEGLSKPWGQPVLVENKVGAAGSIGVSQVARSAPDGYTLGVVPVGNIAVNPSLMPNLPYKPTDLAPVTMLATAENVLVTGSSVPAQTLGELLKLAAQKPGQLTFASAGAVSQAHLAGEMLQLDWR